MMAAALLSSAWGGHSLRENERVRNEEFLKEVGGILGKDTLAVYPEKKAAALVVCSRDDGEEDSFGETASLMSRDKPTPTPLFEQGVIRLQANVRRYLQQRHYRIAQLKLRLQRIEARRQAELDHIERRKEKKRRRARRKYDRQEAKMDQEYQKVSGIVQYLRRDESRCRKEFENHRSLCRQLRAENQRLQLSHAAKLQSAQLQHKQVQDLQATQARLQATLAVQKQAIGLLLQQEAQRSTSNSSSNPTPQPPTRRRRAQHKRAKSYGTAIHVHCLNEVEENCLHYRLVQDVYTVTPRTD